MAAMTDLWQVERLGQIVVLCYDNPPMNYLTSAGFAQFGSVLDDLAVAEVRAVVITGAVTGKFVTHFSVEEILDGQETIAARGPSGNHRTQLLLERLADLPQPVVAALNGDAMGGGFELALACDFRIAQRGDYRIGLPEVRLGIIPGAGGTQRLTRLVGMASALDLLLRARVLTPDEALARGLVHEVADDARTAALTLAHELAQLPPVAVAMAKAAVYQGIDLGMRAAQRVEADASYRAKLAPDASAAMREYLAVPVDKRRMWLDRHEHGLTT